MNNALSLSELGENYLEEAEEITEKINNYSLLLKKAFIAFLSNKL